MKFDAIIGHLAKRGFVTRDSWNGRYVMFFGMDYHPWISGYTREAPRHWYPNLNEINADDWKTLPYFWNGKQDDFLPFKENDSYLESLRGKILTFSEIGQKVNKICEQKRQGARHKS